LRLVGHTVDAAVDLGAYRYNMIRGADLHRRVRGALERNAQATTLHGTVERIDDGAEGAYVVVDGRTYAGRWVFDSRFPLSALTGDQAPYVHLRQHFRGWEIETPVPAFDPHVATFLDFRVPRSSPLSFFYVLPLSAQRALIDHVAIAAEPLAHHEHERSFAAYLSGVLGIAEHSILRVEQGVSPLTDRPFPRRIGRHIMTIGIPGGRLKPSTGYAFLRIQEDSAAIVRSLLCQGHPFAVPPSPRRYRYFDAVILRIMQRHPHWIEPIFIALFTRQPAARFLRCLDEAASWRDNLLMLPAMPARMLMETVCSMGALARV
jgi:lycopene beta-cyclase